jgi:hypothetical protein
LFNSIIELRNEKGIMSEEKNFVTCPCQHCNGNIEFDASLCQTGTKATCPHCGMETVLFIPKIAKVGKTLRAIFSDGITEKTPEKMAKIIEQKEKTYHGGMEDTLENVGGIFLVLGVLGGIAAIVAACIAFNNSETGIGGDLLCVGFISIIAGAVNHIFLFAGAEIIRLLKKVSGLKFSGEITQPTPRVSTYLKCSACGARTYPVYEECLSCGAKFVK